LIYLPAYLGSILVSTRALMFDLTVLKPQYGGVGRRADIQRIVRRCTRPSVLDVLVIAMSIRRWALGISCAYI